MHNFSNSTSYSSPQALPAAFPLNSDPPSNGVNARDCVFPERLPPPSSIHSQIQWPADNQGVDTDSNPPDHPADPVEDDALRRPMDERKRQDTDRVVNSNSNAATEDGVDGVETVDAADAANERPVAVDPKMIEQNTATTNAPGDQKVDGVEDANIDSATREAVEEKKSASEGEKTTSDRPDGKEVAEQKIAEATNHKPRTTASDHSHHPSPPGDGEKGNMEGASSTDSSSSKLKDHHSAIVADVSGGGEGGQKPMDEAPSTATVDSKESLAGNGGLQPKQQQQSVSESDANEPVSVAAVPRKAAAETESNTTRPDVGGAAASVEQRKDDGQRKPEEGSLVDAGKITKDGSGSDSDCVIIGYTQPEAAKVGTKANPSSITVLPLTQTPQTVSSRSKVVPRGNLQPKASSLSLAEVAASKPSPGNQGSAVEYRRLVQKHGQAMSYNVGQTVLFFVPRLASRARFKDRLGTVMRRCDDSRYEIRDQQNDRTETVPWKWILKAPPATPNTRKRSALQRDLTAGHSEAKRLKVSGRPQGPQQRMDRNPMDSLPSKEEKIKEFERRMNSRKSHSKQYSVPIHSSYYDDDDGFSRKHRDLRGRSLHHDVHPPFHQRRFTARNLRSPPLPKARRNMAGDTRPHSHSGYKQVRSFSVFPQRVSRCARRLCRSPPPPLRGDPSPRASHPQITSNSNTASSSITATTTTTTTTAASTAATDNRVRPNDERMEGNDHTAQIKPERTTDGADGNVQGSASLDAPPSHRRDIATSPPVADPLDDLHAQHRYSQLQRLDRMHRGHGPLTAAYPDHHHHRRPRSRSRSPSHIRPSNRILMKDSADSNVTPSTPRDGRFSESLSEMRYGRHPRRYPLRPPSRVDPFYEGYYHRFRDHRYFRESLPPQDYPRELPPPRYASPPPPKPPTPPPAKMDLPIGLKASQSMHRGRPHRSRSRSRSRERMRDYYGVIHPHYAAPYEYPEDRERRERFYYHDRRERDREHQRRCAYYGADRRESETYYAADDRTKRAEGTGNGGDSLSQNLLMQSWLQVQLRMRGGCKLAEREISYLCRNDVYPENIKQMMDADKPVQEKYDLVAHYVDPSNGQNLSRSQVYSIIGAIITMKF